MNIKKLALGLCLILSTFSAGAQIKEVTILGEIKNLGSKEVVLLNAEQQEITKTMAINGKFKIIQNLEIGDMRYYSIYVPSVGPLEPSMSIPYFSFFICSGLINIQATIKDKIVNLISIKGSPCGDEYNRLLDSLPATKELNDLYRSREEASSQYDKAETDQNLAKLNESNEKLDKMEAERRKQIMALIPANPKSMTLAVLASDFCMPEEVKDLEIFYNQFDPSIRYCYALEQIKQKISQLKLFEIGQSAPDFELKNQEGKSIKLSSFQGKYLLLDFWASWCGPCRAENPVVVKAFNKYKDKGFTVLGVAVWDAKTDWLKAIKEDGMPWTQVLDDKKSTNHVQKQYDITSIPTNFLIDPQGRIIARDLRGENLEKALEEFIK